MKKFEVSEIVKTENKKRNVKSILLRWKLKGRGVVNFDSSDQRFVLGSTDLGYMKTRHDNTNYAKKRLYKNGDKWGYKLTTSSDFLLHNIFSDIPFQSPNVQDNVVVLHSYLASPSKLVRGWLETSKIVTLKRKGSLTLVDAEQTNDSVSHIETFAKSGRKDDEDNGATDNTFFKKEVVGDIEYQTVGSIDLSQLQFISCDDIFDRMAFDPDNFELFKKFLQTKLPNFNSELSYFQMKNSIIEIPEWGFLLSQENVNFLVNDLLQKMLRLNVTKRDAFVKSNLLEVKFVYDILEDTLEDENGWVEVNPQTKVEFESEVFYNEVDLKKSKELRESIEVEYKNRKKKSAEKKEPKKGKKNEE
jgi:hypothetical protein